MASMYFRSDDLSDVRILIVADYLESDAVASKRQRRNGTAEMSVRLEGPLLDKFPAHGMQLSIHSEVMKMMINRSTHGSIVLAMDPAHLQASRSLFASMYGVPDNNKDALVQQDQATLVRVLFLADRYAVQRTTEAALKLLKRQLYMGSFNATGLQALFDLEAWPDLFLPMLPKAIHAKLDSTDTDKDAAVTRMLLHVLGDLEEVWTSRSRKRDLLLQLPLRGLELLLSSSGVRVASEDTILYTITRWVRQRNSWAAAAAPPTLPDLNKYSPDKKGFKTYKARLLAYEVAYSQYMQKVQDREQRIADMAVLPGLVRFPLLSPLVCSSVVPQLSWLNNLGSAGVPWLSQINTQQKVLTSWRSGARLSSATTCFSFTLVTTVGELQQAAKKAMTSGKETAGILSRSTLEAAFAGHAWQAYWLLKRPPQKPTRADGVLVGLYLKPSFPGVGNILWRPKAKVECAGVVECLEGDKPLEVAFGLRDVFDLGPMAGGWDAAAWAAKGLPTEMSTEVKATFTVSL